ncbi:MAG: flagellar basal body P-ring protein FlgI [Gammaproteobacteria bacterium]|nr:flagellar basal body P-ring protein FlgI [Gammaproteobacteria bacterium]MBT3488980.1 flagellar basal body P-ring protein FlgI [Gammaproteobacteria bacterium]MBT3717452.1 flagellar basal body P-ring protein FlgI [Gammaproteobacteria bacterium]MBT3844620.1 flagellar basal body P-ring protein FlgI [Gammaproteobacteria bacterium]MBT3892771.1 flagellar basal body P-ring protein FlgI [Gammaproteobacteria bacterium]
MDLSRGIMMKHQFGQKMYSKPRKRVGNVILFILIITLAAIWVFSSQAHAERIKDLASVAGVRDNPLIGYGLVVGLSNTGDNNSKFAGQSLSSMLSRFGIQTPPGVDVDTGHVAAVMVSAELPPFAKQGQRLDVTVSTLGDSSSLVGGTLLMTQLRGADNETYAIAQGSLVVSGFGVNGLDGSKVQVNTLTVGRVPEGAMVEREVATSFVRKGRMTFNLHQNDFTTVKRVVEAIDELYGEGTAEAVDSVSVEVMAPKNPRHHVEFLSMLENLEISPAEAAAKVIINSRTGTVVINNSVKVSPAAVTHGSLVVTIKEGELVEQPNMLAGGETVVQKDSEITVDKENKPMFLFNGGVSLDQLVDAVNAVGAAPGDLVAILEALKRAGALKAQLVVL